MWEVYVYNHAGELLQKYNFVDLVGAIAFAELSESSINWEAIKENEQYEGYGDRRWYQAVKANPQRLYRLFEPVAWDTAREYARQVIERLNEG
jgi:hypothetical protein